jgi:hypothetical protein
MLPRFTPEAMEANQTLVDLLKRIAEQKRLAGERPATRTTSNDFGVVGRVRFTAPGGCLLPDYARFESQRSS